MHVSRTNHQPQQQHDDDDDDYDDDERINANKYPFIHNVITNINEINLSFL